MSDDQIDRALGRAASLVRCAKHMLEERREDKARDYTTEARRILLALQLHRLATAALRFSALTRNSQITGS